MLSRQKALYCNVKGSLKAESYIVVDIGGGTVDIVAYQIRPLPQPHMEVIHEPTGEAWGGRKVNLLFKEFLENLTKDEGFKQYTEIGLETKCAKHRAELDEIIEEKFEAQKSIFGDTEMDESAQISVHLNYSFLKTYKDIIEESLQNDLDTCVNIDDSDLRIHYEKVRTFFDPVVDGIINCVSKVFEDVPDAHTVYLVGGFGGCQFIYNKFCSKFGDSYQFITPDGRSHAVVKGAAMMVKDPQFLNVRRVDATYGIETAIPFVEGKHDEQYRIKSNVEGEPDMCSNIFTTFVEKGDIVTSREMYMLSFTPERNDQTCMKILIYRSEERDVWYTTGKRPAGASEGALWADVQYIGELIVPFHDSDESLEDKTVDVMFDFSSAEIKVTGFHCKSATEIKVVLNFLEP